VTKNRGLVQQRIKSLPDKTIPVPGPPRWNPPEPDPDLEYKVNIPMPGLGRIIGRTQFDVANRTEFAMTAQVHHDGMWWDVARVDTVHGEVHAHFMYRTRSYEDREVLLEVFTQNDVDTGFQQAEALLIACWAENVTRWRGGS
jgi:hypothetical protein